MSDLDPKSQITKMSFGSEDCHVAVVHKLQGGASNGYKEALLLRATADITSEDEVKLIREVQNVNIRLSFEEFLRKFFNLYNEDAYILTKILGFETELSNNEDIETYQQYLDKKVDAISILRSVSTEKDFLNLPFERKETVIKFQERFERSFLNKEEKMSTEDNSEQVQDLLRAVSDLSEKLKVEQEKREALEAKELEREKKAILERASAFDFISEGDVATAAVALHSLDEESREIIFRAFESARKKLEVSAKRDKSEEDMFRAASLSVEDDLDARTLASRKIMGGGGK